MCEESMQVRIMKDAEVEQITSLSRNTRQALSKRGEFPSPVWITRRTRGYMSDEIVAWMDERRDKRSIPQQKPWIPQAQQSGVAQ